MSIEQAGGVRVNTNGDAVFAAFRRPLDAVTAAAAAQRALAAASWPEGVSVRVRIGLHTGEAELAGQDYAGLEVHRAARISAAAHGGQVLISSATHELVGRDLPAGIGLRDLGAHRLKDIPRPERLYQLQIDGLPSEFPPLRTLDAWRTSLPATPTSFIGREQEVAEATALLAQTRLLTLTGPGGTGKTRLALRIADEAAESYRDRVIFVALAALEDPSLVASTVAAAAGAQEEAGRPILDSLADRLAGMEVLLVLDNFEQVLPAAAVVSALLAAGPAVRILVTSRAPLRVSGEREYAVQPLGLPDPGRINSPQELAEIDAVALFVDRAQAIDPDFTLGPDNAGDVAAICVALDGLPLAIELAAARVRLLAPSAILERLGTCLTLLTGGPRDSPEHQRTLGGTIRWSYDLLDRDGQVMFGRLAVFAGGWDLTAAEAVCTDGSGGRVDPLEALDTLVQQSLVRRAEDATGRRFRMLQPIREFALERLAESGEEPDVRDRHLRYFLALAQEMAGELTGPGQAYALDRLSADHDNLRAALRWCVDADRAEAGLRIAAGIWRFWHLRDHLAEGEARLTELLAAPSAPATGAARADGTNALAAVVYWRGDYAGARERYEDALGLYVALGDEAGAAGVQASLGWVSAATGDWARARRCFAEAADAARTRDDRVGLGFALHGLGMSALRDGDGGAARDALEEAVGLLRASGDRFGLANALYDYGRALAADGERDPGRQALREALDLHAAAGDMSGVAFVLDAMSGLAAEEGQPRRAVRLAGAADAMREALGARAPSSIVGEWDVRAAVHDQLRDEEVGAAWDEGRRMDLERVLNDVEGGDHD
jgi:predicted ATPase